MSRTTTIFSYFVTKADIQIGRNEEGSLEAVDSDRANLCYISPSFPPHIDCAQLKSRQTIIVQVLIDNDQIQMIVFIQKQLESLCIILHILKEMKSKKAETSDSRNVTLNRKKACQRSDFTSR